MNEDIPSSYTSDIDRVVFILDDNLERRHRSTSIFAIDFDDTNSVVCMLKKGHVEVISDGSDSRIVTFPSFVEYKGDDILVGTPAKDRHVNGVAKYCVSCFRRLLGLTWNEYQTFQKKDIFGVDVVSGNDGYPRFVVSDTDNRVTCIEVASELFHKIKVFADARNGTWIEDCYVTVPVNYSIKQQNALKESMKLAGLNVKSIITKPIAVVMYWYYYHEKESVQGEIIVVFDMGSNSYDISLLEYDGDGIFSVLGTDGEELGGNDLDTWIAKEICSRAGINMDFLFNTLKTKKRSLFLAACKEAKEQLSMTYSAYIDVSILESDYGELLFTQVSLKDLVGQLCINECIDRLMDQSNRTCRQVKRVFMVGGSSRLPGAREILEKRFSSAKFPEIDPDTSAAKGALVMAHLSTIQNQM